MLGDGFRTIYECMHGTVRPGILPETRFWIIMGPGKGNYRKGVIMSFHSQLKRGTSIHRAALACVFLLASATASNAVGFSSTNNSEVSPKYKARKVGNLQLSIYKDELIDCSALAGIHTWLDDNLGNAAGSEVRKKLNGDYWVDISTAYLDLAQQASGTADLSAEMGARMRVLAAQFRDLTEAPAGTANWAEWYDLIDSCDSWRVDKPAQAFFNNGRTATAQSSQAAEVAKAPY